MKKFTIILILIALTSCNNDRAKMEGLIKKRDKLKISRDSIYNEMSINTPKFPEFNSIRTEQEIKTSDSIYLDKRSKNNLKYFPLCKFYDSAYNETLKQIEDLKLIMNK